MDETSQSFDQYKYRNRLSLGSKLARLIWDIVWLVLFRPTPSWCLDGWRKGLLCLFGARIGKGCRIASSCKVWAPWNLEMGSYVCLANNVDCYCVAPITLGSKVTISQYSILCSASHDITSLHRPLIQAPITIGDHVWVCAGAFVGPGVGIGEGAVAGARAVVFKDVDPWTVVAGNPACFVKKREIKEQP